MPPADSAVLMMRLSYDRPPFAQDHDPGQTVHLTAATAAELDARLDDIAAQAATWPLPVTVGIAPPPDDEAAPALSIVLGRDNSAVNYDRDLPGPDRDWSQSEDLWSWNGTDTEDPPFNIAYSGTPLSLPAWAVIPADHARQAAREFFTTGGKRPAVITWRTT